MRIILYSFIFVALGIGVLWLLPQRQIIEQDNNPPALPREQAKSGIRDVTPEDALQGPDVSQQILTRLPDRKQPEKKKEVVTHSQYRNVIIERTGFIRSTKLEIRLEGIEPLALDHTCITSRNESWPCGRFARTALRRLIRGRVIDCDLAEPQNDMITTRCRIAGHDIGSWLVKQGWAKDANGDYMSQMEQAKQALKGMWRTSLP